jgi:surface carbohydrate biosynthesis protein (TIGR04326 family)
VLHAYLNIRSVIGAFRDYIRIGRWGRRLRVVPDLFVEPTTGIDPSPLLAELIEDQYFGRTAALNAFWIRLWESALARWPCQRLGVYLFENQPWELAFIAAWRASGNGDLIGFSHSTMLFWDLRYFMDASVHVDSRRLRLPQATLIAVNDPRMRVSAIKGNYQASRLIEVENLRMRQPGSNPPSHSEQLILLLGDYDQESTARMVEMVLDASTAFPDFKLQLRPHPATNHVAWTATYGILTNGEETLESQLLKARKVVTGAHTSASLDALRGGRQTASVQTPRSFPGNPAEGLPGFASIKSSPEMIRFVTGNQEEKFHPPGLENGGQLDLTSWRQVLTPKHKDAQA